MIVKTPYKSKKIMSSQKHKSPRYSFKYNSNNKAQELIELQECINQDIYEIRNLSLLLSFAKARLKINLDKKINLK